MIWRDLIFASGKCLYPIGEGGGETIAHDLLRGLARRGRSVRALGALALKDVSRLNGALKELSSEIGLETRTETIVASSGREYSITAELRAKYTLDYPVTASLYEHFLHDVQEELTSSPPSLLLLQAEISPQILQLAKAAKVPVIFYAQNGLELAGFSAPQEIGLVLTNSRFYQERLSQQYHVRCELLYPAVDLEKYAVTENTHEFITMINPVAVKGIGQFLQLALALPQRRFLVVEGWGTPGHIREIIGKMPNVTYLPKQLDMRQVYRRTHILLVPSQWEEAFGRVVVEAQFSGIPVVASAVGGLPESLGEGGLLVHNFREVEAWRTALSEAEERYEELSRKARENARRFGVDQAVSRLEEIIAAF